MVTVESDSEDVEISDHDNNDGEDDEQVQQPQDNGANITNAPTEEVQHDQNVEEIEGQQQNGSNVDNAHDETLNQNEKGKENIRPQSTPIAKVETPTVAVSNSKPSLDSTNATAPSVASVAVKLVVASKPPLIEKIDAENINEAGTSGVLGQSKKCYICPHCDETFMKKSLAIKHSKVEHSKKKRHDKKSIEAPGFLVRKKPSQKRKHIVVEDNTDDDDDTDDGDDNIENESEQKIYYIVPNPMKQAMKRQKKGTPKFN